MDVQKLLPGALVYSLVYKDVNLSNANSKKLTTVSFPYNSCRKLSLGFKSWLFLSMTVEVIMSEQLGLSRQNRSYLK